jgi:hypothetical protein
VRRSLAILLVATLIAACSPQPSATASAPPGSLQGPTSTPTASPVSSPSEAPSLGPGAWVESYSSDLAVLDDIVAGPQGLIAAGCTSDASGTCLQALLLTSPDGVAWTTANLDGAAHTLISRLRWVGDRLFALGYRIDDQAQRVDSVVWDSLDGRSWAGVPSASSKSRVVTDIVASPTGNLAVGINAPYASEGFGFIVWDVAPDGAFSEPRDVRAPNGPPLAGAAWVGDRFLAWGLGGPLGEVQVNTFLSSPDGKAWTVVPEVAAFRGSAVSQVIADGAGLVAVGSTDGQPSLPRAWTSSDGTAWQAAEVPADPGAMDNVNVEGSELVARGMGPAGTQERPMTWTSIDGEVWTLLPAGEDMPDLAGFRALDRAVLGGRACAAGTFYGDPQRPEPRAAIYCR